jgi:hypothetical protein
VYANITAYEVTPPELVVKLKSIAAVPSLPGHIAEADFERPFTVTVSVIVAPYEHPDIAANVPP